MIVGASEVSITIKSTRYITKITANEGEENSDLISVSTSKDLESPAGSFQIVLVPKKTLGETWFDRVKVFDFVEISFKGMKDPEKKVIMRGLVDTIQLSESYESGIPQRTVQITGRDLGSLLLDFEIYLIPVIKEQQEAAMQGMGLLFMEATKRGLVEAPVADLYNFLMQFFKDNYLDITILGDYEKKLKDYLQTKAKAFFTNLKTGAMYFKEHYGKWYNIFKQFQDPPFHELFVYDTDSYSWLILRPSRYKDAKGVYPGRISGLLDDKDMYPSDFSIYNDEKISMTTAKSSQEIKNMYITYPSAGVFGGKQSFWSVAIMPNINNLEKSVNPYVALDKSLPSYLNKFGYRPYEVETVFYNFPVQSTEEKYKDRNEKEQSEDFIPTGEEMNKTLVAWFLHNPLLVNATVDIAGTNRALIGTYMKDEDEKMEYYVYGVSHNFQLFQSFRTSLQLKRGIPFGGLGENSNKYFFPV